MAKKKTKPLEREERPEFLALLGALPDDEEALHGRVGQLRAIYNDAILAGDELALDLAKIEHEAIIFKLNGGTFFGCFADDTRPGKVLDAQHTLKPGQVPHWGQSGEFLVEVDGVRVLVGFECRGMADVPGFDATAVDSDKPYFSETGFRNFYMPVGAHLCSSLEQAVRAEIAECISKEGLRPIKPEHREKREKLPPWLQDALAGVTRDGQLAMFGDQPEPKKPLTGAQRQQRRRDKLRELKKTEGLKPVMLNAAERKILRNGLDLFNEHNNPTGDAAAEQLALLRKIAPGADWRPAEARPLASMRWSAEAGKRHAQREQQAAEREARQWKARAEAAERALLAIGAEQVDGQWQGVEQLPEDMAALLAERGPVVVCLDALHRVRETVRVANHDIQRAADARHEAARLRSENELLEKERNGAMSALKVFEQRLRAAGLSTDYRG